MNTVNKTRKRFWKMWRELEKKGVASFDSIWIYDEGEDQQCLTALLNPIVYKIVKKHWGEKYSPFVMAVLYQIEESSARHSYENLYGMLLADCFQQAMTPEELAVRQTLLALISSIEADKGNRSDAAVGLRELNGRFFEKVKQTTLKMSNMDCNGGFMETKEPLNGVTMQYMKYDGGTLRTRVPLRDETMKYFEAVTAPILKKIFSGESLYELFCDYRWYVIAEKLGVPKELDRDVVSFLIDDAVGYYAAFDLEYYNPYWIYGSANFDEIWKRVRRIYRETQKHKFHIDRTPITAKN